MAKRRTSVRKREREIVKRQRELRKSRKAAEKRERRLKPDRGIEPAPTRQTDVEAGQNEFGPRDSTGPEETGIA